MHLPEDRRGPAGAKHPGSMPEPVNGSLPDVPSSSGTGGTPSRVRVTAPRTAARATGASFPVAREMAEQSEVGQLFVASLMRSQLRLALVVAAGFLVVLIAIPVLLAVFPDIEAVSVLTVPVPWLLLGLGVYPLVIGSAVLYERSASRNEQRFQDLVDDD